MFPAPFWHSKRKFLFVTYWTNSLNSSFSFFSKCTSSLISQHFLTKTVLSERKKCEKWISVGPAPYWVIIICIHFLDFKRRKCVTLMLHCSVRNATSSVKSVKWSRAWLKVSKELSIFSVKITDFIHESKMISKTNIVITYISLNILWYSWSPLPPSTSASSFVMSSFSN